MRAMPQGMAAFKMTALNLNARRTSRSFAMIFIFFISFVDDQDVAKTLASCVSPCQLSRATSFYNHSTHFRHYLNHVCRSGRAHGSVLH